MEKVIKGWILGKDGLYRVNPKWKSIEETLVQNTSEGRANTKKEVMRPLVREGEELVKAGLVKDKRPAEKKKKFEAIKQARRSQKE